MTARPTAVDGGTPYQRSRVSGEVDTRRLAFDGAIRPATRAGTLPVQRRPSTAQDRIVGPNIRAGAARPLEERAGLLPCGFHSPFEAAAWAVVSQRIRVVQAARLRDRLVHRHGHDGASPAPHVLRTLELDLPGRRSDSLHAWRDGSSPRRRALSSLRFERAISLHAPDDEALARVVRASGFPDTGWHFIGDWRRP